MTIEPAAESKPARPRRREKYITEIFAGQPDGHYKQQHGHTRVTCYDPTESYRSGLIGTASPQGLLIITRPLRVAHQAPVDGRQLLLL